MSARTIALAAPAKVNLGLEVLGKRPDGFHEVDTVLIALELGDRLMLSTFERRAEEEPVRLELRGPSAHLVPADASNPAVRAASGVLELARARTGIAILLEKRVPAASGLGGGSSDAAAAALGAALLVEHPLDDPRLVELLGRLGSDCPFFLAARASGLTRWGTTPELIARSALAAIDNGRIQAVIAGDPRAYRLNQIAALVRRALNVWLVLFAVAALLW